MADAASGATAAFTRAQPFQPDAAPLHDLPAVLADAGFDAPSTERTLAKAGVHGDLDRPYLRRLLEEPTPHNTLVRLFLLSEEVSDSAAVTALGRERLERLVRVGLLAGGARVRAHARIAPYRDLLLASDPRPRDQAPPADHVLGVAPTSDILARLTPRSPRGKALDLGTGCGVHALLAARHCGTAIGTDIGERALTFARLNARINGIDNAEWRRGAFFAPVDGSRFDLIVSNPPFAISPETTYLYRDAEHGGVAVSGTVVTGAAAHLAPGGFALSLVSWPHARDEDWEEQPRAWVAGTDCDTWLLRAHSVTALDYAAFFLRQTELHDPAMYERRLDEWVRYYADNGMERLAIGTIVLRRRTGGSPWFRADTVPSDRIVGECGAHVETIFRNEDLLRGIGDERRLLDLRLRIHAAHRLEQVLRLDDAQWLAERSTLTIDHGIVTAGSVDPPVVHLLQGCDGSRAFGAAVADVAVAMGADVSSVLPHALRTATRLLRTGILEWADGES